MRACVSCLYEVHTPFRFVSCRGDRRGTGVVPVPGGAGAGAGGSSGYAVERGLREAKRAMRETYSISNYPTVAKVTLRCDSSRLLLFGLTTHACDTSSLARGSRSSLLLYRPLHSQTVILDCIT